jgi:hypothetical protein
LLPDPDGYLRDLARELCREGHTRQEVLRELWKQVRRAQEYARRATRGGRLTWPELCERCGDRPPEMRHHKSYHPDRRTDVEWLCNDCHKDAHDNDDVPKVDLLQLADCDAA